MPASSTRTTRTGGLFGGGGGGGGTWARPTAGAGTGEGAGAYNNGDRDYNYLQSQSQSGQYYNYPTPPEAAAAGGAIGIGGASSTTTAVADGVVDAYAQSVLESYYYDEAAAATSSKASTTTATEPSTTSSTTTVSAPDDSLGAYVTSALRERRRQQRRDENAEEEQEQGVGVEGDDDDIDDEERIAVEESLVELLQEHCGLSVEKAREALRVVDAAVRTGRVPPTAQSSATSGGRASSIRQQQQQQQQQQRPYYRVQVEGLDGTAVPPLPHHHSSSVLSPLHEDKLILGDLMGELLGQEESSENNADEALGSAPELPTLFRKDPLSSSSTMVDQDKKMSDEDFPPLGTSPHSTTDDFPPLGKPSGKPPGGSNAGSSRKKKGKFGSGGGNAGENTSGGGDKNNSVGTDSKKVAADLAASLFTTAYASGTATSGNGYRDANGGPATASTLGMGGTEWHRQQQEQQVGPYGYAYAGSSAIEPPSAEALHGAIEFVLSMNVDLSEDAATAAVDAAQADISVAQYLVDRAASAPPICRHLLSNGCYRKDCQYSHDLAGHTCTFWLRGRCGKGTTCRFRHGFDDGAVREAFEQVYLQQQSHQQQQQQQQHYPDGRTHGDVYDNGGYYDYSSGYDMMYDANSYVGGGDPSLQHALHQPQIQQQIAPAPASGPSSFVNIAARGYDTTSSYVPPPSTGRGQSYSPPPSGCNRQLPTVKIPQDLWTASETRDSSAFHIPDPIDRFNFVTASQVSRPDVLDLHFQSMKTFPVVLSSILPQKLSQCDSVWIVTGTGHHVGSQTHQKGGGALESAVMQWLDDEGYAFSRGKDRNGQGGAIFVEKR